MSIIVNYDIRTNNHLFFGGTSHIISSHNTRTYLPHQYTHLHIRFLLTLVKTINMRTSTIAASAATLAGLASAVPSAVITIETSHGGAGSGLTNKTITVPVGPVYTNSEALNAVSTLYLTGASEIAINSISCTPYRSVNGSGSRGLPFSSTTPSYLSTNTVQVGSIVCLTNSTSSSNGTSTGGGNGTAIGGGNGTATGGNGGSGNATSTLLVTPTPTAAPTSTSAPATNGAVSAANIPYYMSGLLVGFAGVMFGL